ncbi:MAG: hypothetical protein M5U09_05600 [Gammaproteobacteria bacterium]|nr:hypothetical protein [Gammaproteobacteria bacterium]
MSAASSRLMRPAAGLLILAALATASATAHGARLLVSNDDAAATIDESFVCDRVAPVSIESSSFELFEADSLRMQSLVDSVQAVLRYECGDLEELDVTGYLKGLAQPVYEARARAVDGWHVDAIRTLKPGAAAAPPPAADAVQVREIAVAGNRLDMTVDEVGANIREIFGAEPAYHGASGVMTLELGGCPPDYFDGGRAHGNPESGWTCVEALFSDRRVPTLYRFAYTRWSKAPWASRWTCWSITSASPTATARRPAMVPASWCGWWSQAMPGSPRCSGPTSTVPETTWSWTSSSRIPR